MTTVTITEFLEMKTGTGAKGPWKLYKAKDSLGRTLATFDQGMGELLAANVGKQVEVEGTARKPEYPNNITLSSLVVTGESAPSPVAEPAVMASNGDDKDRRITMIAIAKSTLENGDLIKSLLSTSSLEMKENEKWSVKTLAATVADFAADVATQVTDRIMGSKPAPAKPTQAEINADLDSIPF